MAIDLFNTASGARDTSRAGVTGAIKQAAASTGASFEYLVSTAKMESNLDPSASASTSSAKGLYQFIEQTWLGTVKEAGAQFGYGAHADAISKSASGTYSVDDATAKAKILKLRDDPVASSAMAGVLTQSNSFSLTAKIGRRPTDGELYMAHFMGVGGAAKLINAASDTPNASGAGMFPNAAAANQSIFYDKSGAPRTVSGVYADLSARYASAANSPATRMALAAAGVTPSANTGSVVPAPTQVASLAAPSNAVSLSSFPDLRTAKVASFASDPSGAPPVQPTFRSLYQPGDRAEPVSPAVQELWGNGSSLTSSATPASSTTASAATPTASAAPSGAIAQPAVRTPRPLDLFSDRSGNFSG
jgi:hypothetical protein